MDSRVVFDASPLNQYLEAAASSPAAASRLKQKSNARSRRAVLLRDLVRAVRASVPQEETDDFLERFRYSVVSSQLLEAHPMPAAGLDRPLAAKFPSQAQRQALYGSESCGAGLASTVTATATGGCILCLGLVLHWAVRARRREVRGLETAAVTVVVVAVALFLYAHSRRKVLRRLRDRALSLTASLVARNRSFDETLRQAMAFLLELDMHKHRPVGPVLERSRAGKHLCSALTSALFLACSTYLDAINDCLEYVDEPDLLRYLDLYDLDLRRVDDMFAGSRTGAKLSSEARNYGVRRLFASRTLNRDAYAGSRGANTPLPELKFEVAKMHFLRRVFLCCLLSLPSTGQVSNRELDAWSRVVAHQTDCVALVAQLAAAVDRTRTLAAVPDDSRQAAGPRLAPAHARVLNDLAASVLHLEAQLHLLQDSLETQPSEDYYTDYEIVGSDIRLLMDAWTQGLRVVRGEAEERIEQAQEHTQEQRLDHQSQKDGQVTDQPAEKPFHDLDDEPSVFSSTSTLTSDLGFGHRRTDTNVSLLSTTSSSTVLSGVADGPDRAERASVSRQERIIQLKLKREADHQRHADQQKRHSFVVELDSVLKARR